MWVFLYFGHGFCKNNWNKCTGILLIKRYKVPWQQYQVNIAMSTTPIASLTCNQINSQKSEDTKISVCHKCKSWMDDRHYKRFKGKEQSGANKRRYGCEEMQPMSPLLEGIDETEQILLSNNSDVHETGDYVPINLDHHMESTTTDV